MKRSLFIVLFFLSLSTAFAQESAKASFFRDMINPIYVSWPGRVDTIDIAVIKNRELYDELKGLARNSLGVFKKSVKVTYYANPNKVTRANIIYVHKKNFPNIDRLQARMKEQDCLIVGENYPFGTAMINIIESDGNTFFEINEDRIGSQNIRLKNNFKKKRSNSPEQWAELLRKAEAEIQVKNRDIQRKAKTIEEKQEALDITSDSLEQTSLELDSTNVELAITSDSLTYAQLLVKQKEERLAYERKLRTVFIVIIVLSLAIVFFIFNIYRTKKRHAEKLRRLNEQLAHRNKEILDSIQYAQRIQEAILPTSKIVKEYLEESFIIFKPKDIVSGDFYWMETYDGKILYAAVDCTGHGVPGAFVSIVGYDGLNRAMREFHLSQPAEIMDKLNEFVDETFEKSEEEIKDGMDMALCAVDPRNNKLEYAGANNPLYVIRPRESGNLEVDGAVIEPALDSPSHCLFEVKADKQPIGKFSGRHPFTNREVKVVKGDTFYTFSDGYADQFGGPKGKKFKYKPFKELLLRIQHKNMLEQRTIIHETFETWKNDAHEGQSGYEQIDDVVVIGVRIQ